MTSDIGSQPTRPLYPVQHHLARLRERQGPQEVVVVQVIAPQQRHFRDSPVRRKTDGFGPVLERQGAGE